MEELPVIIKNSHLLNSVLCELQEMSPSPKKYTFLDLSTSNVLEKNLRSLIENVDELGSETNKFLNHHKQLQKQNHLKQQYLQKRVRFSKFLRFKQIKKNLNLGKLLFRKLKIRQDAAVENHHCPKKTSIKFTGHYHRYLAWKLFLFQIRLRIIALK